MRSGRTVRGWSFVVIPNRSSWKNIIKSIQWHGAYKLAGSFYHSNMSAWVLTFTCSMTTVWKHSFSMCLSRMVPRPRDKVKPNRRVRGSSGGGTPLITSILFVYCHRYRVNHQSKHFCDPMQVFVPVAGRWSGALLSVGWIFSSVASD